MPSPPSTAAPGTLPNMDLPSGVTLNALAVNERDHCAPVPFASSLLGKPVRRCCSRSESRDADFMAGCRLASACSIELDGRLLSTREQLGAAIAPIDSPAKALAFASLTVEEAWTPMTAAEAAKHASDMQWRVVDPALHAFDVVQDDRGWHVKFPAYSYCGCDHALWQLAFDVTAAGSICPSGPPAALAAQSGGMCVD